MNLNSTCTHERKPSRDLLKFVYRYLSFGLPIYRCPLNSICRVLITTMSCSPVFLSMSLNHFSTTGRCRCPAHFDVSIRQAARAAFVTSSFKIFLTQTFPRCGATCYILPSRAMTQLFNSVNFVYRSVEVYLTFCSYLRVLFRI